MIYSFNGFTPIVHESAYVHPLAAVTGNVTIGAKVYIGPGAAIRADWGEIIIGDGCNVQENCTIHMFPGTTTVLEEHAHIGHGAIIHGASIGRNAMIGMNAVVMDEAIIGADSIIGALTFVKAKMEVPARSLVVGNPGKIIKEVSEEMIDWKSKGTALYQTLPAECMRSLHPTMPLSEAEVDRPKQEKMYEVWEKLKNGQLE